jgi:hypothetical protein
MGRFEARVQILDVTEPDAPTAVRTVEERLRNAGFNRWRVVSLRPQAVRISARPLQRRAVRREVSNTGRAILLATFVAYALWLLWLIAG